MKKIFLAIIFIIALTISVSAQYKPFQFGLKIEPGVSLTKLNSEHLSDNKTKPSFTWGFVGNFYFVENYGVSTGFNVKFMSNQYTFENESPNIPNDNLITRTIKNKYLEIPICLTMRTEKIGKLRIKSDIGYGLGISLDTKEKNHNSKNEEISMITASSYNQIRHALIVKLGVDYHIYKASYLTTSLVFNNNFTNIYKKNDVLKHNVLLNNLCLEIGFMF